MIIKGDTTYLNNPSIYNEYYDTNSKNIILPKDCYFVFGSNIAGIHGKGAALYARHNYSAKLGVGVGFTGMSYAIPTKDRNLQTLSLDAIAKYVNEFVGVSLEANHRFFVTAVGCGLAGYKPSQIAPMFKGAKYCYFPSSWIEYLF